MVAPVLRVALLVLAATTLVRAEGPLPKPLPWRVTLVDAESKAPLPGAVVTCSVRDEPDGDTHKLTLTADTEGSVEIPLVPGEATFVYPRTPGRWTGGLAMVGDFDIDGDGDYDTKPREESHQISLWRGTVVRGRLVDPDCVPVAGVTLHAGVYINNTTWDEKLGRGERIWQSWDHGQWPNWETHYETDAEGNFAITAPPRDARSYIRIGTRRGTYERVETDRLAENHPDSALVRFVPLDIDVSEWNGDDQYPCEVLEDGTLDVGDLRLERGVVLHGRVLDADGKPLGGVHIYTAARHGPYSGRATVSDDDGSYRFAPMASGELKLTPEATFRDEEGKKVSRDVQAVFVGQTVVLPEGSNEVELDIRALPHVDLDFDWVDRRKEKAPIAYYGTLPIQGFVPTESGERTWWRGETFLAERDGKTVLTVKAPACLEDARIQLANDSRVTATYEDAEGLHGPGQIPLGDITADVQRTVYADEPLPKNRK